MSGQADNIERNLIGALLADPGAYLGVAVSAGTRREWFTDDAWGVTWDALAAIWARGGAATADAAIVMAEARRIAAAENNPILKDTITASRFSDAIEGAGIGVADYCATLKDAFLKKKMRAAWAKIAAQIDALTAETFAVDLRTAIDDVLEDATRGREIRTGEVYAGIMDEYRMAYQKRIVEKRLDWTPGLRMPWTELTRIMNGVRAGLHIIAARPSVGKTSFAVNLMRYWADNGVRVVFCSLDMPRKEALRRFLSERARVSVSKAIFSPTQTDLDALARAEGEQSALPITVVETRDVDDLATYCHVQKTAGKIDVCVIDYIQLLHARALGREDAVEYARISYVSNALKDLANRLELPVVALCQLNRESTKAERAGQMPGLSDLRGSGSIEQDAFTVAILHRDAQVTKAWDAAPPVQYLPGGAQSASMMDAVWFNLCKSQNGGTGAYPFVVWKPYFAWMIADYAAKAGTYETGAGATRATVIDNTPKFRRVHADWRHDPLEAALRQSGALLEEMPMRDGPRALPAAVEEDDEHEDLTDELDP